MVCVGRNQEMFWNMKKKNIICTDLSWLSCGYNAFVIVGGVLWGSGRQDNAQHLDTDGRKHWLNRNSSCIGNRSVYVVIAAPKIAAIFDTPVFWLPTETK